MSTGARSFGTREYQFPSPISSNSCNCRTFNIQHTTSTFILIAFLNGLYHFCGGLATRGQSWLTMINMWSVIDLEIVLSNCIWRFFCRKKTFTQCKNSFLMSIILNPYPANYLFSFFMNSYPVSYDTARCIYKGLLKWREVETLQYYSLSS